ncbi:hypothetical protein AZE42_11434 [Rhizopogon vesiculosus]|uniref:Uncharacterized protein n=1 Tax=Rhizopogon vesiculosus TaxID=180088 RepID=A0A1J8QKA0_9AGAM|nr:hypothetical protein AZE42_11434 [Rhizopogon vesiculosus]
MGTSSHASEAAVRILDEQPKRKRPHASAAMIPSASDPHGAVLHV